MNRLAFFVEGKTEAVFVVRLIKEIAGDKDITIEHNKITGGKRVEKSIDTISISGTSKNTTHYILIYDCGGDKQVKTRILEEHRNLSQAGYQRMVGMRDLYPDIQKADITKFRSLISTQFINTRLIPVEFILSEMEIEAWFIAETQHLSRIDNRLTPSIIKSHLGFDPSTDDMSALPHPADSLHQAYSIYGKAYSKSNTDRTINALSYESLYVHTTQKFNDLCKLVSILEDFIFTP